jgi:hypothetical protein
MSLVWNIVNTLTGETIAVKADRQERAGGYGWGII